MKNLLIALGLLLLRLTIGGLMLMGHGWPKLTGYGEKAAGFADPLGIGSQLSLISTIGAEVGCSILLILGLATRPAAAVLAFTMGVAVFIVHEADAWEVKELAATYLAVYASLILTGAGRISADALISRKRHSTAK